jgi:UDPglucose 6-dehydrogenase
MGNRIQLTENQYDCLRDADALIIATEWNEFRAPDFDLITSLLKEPVIFDGRNIFDLPSMTSRGFHYVSIGRPVVELPIFVYEK